MIKHFQFIASSTYFEKHFFSSHLIWYFVKNKIKKLLYSGKTIQVIYDLSEYPNILILSDIRILLGSIQTTLIEAPTINRSLSIKIIPYEYSLYTTIAPCRSINNNIWEGHEALTEVKANLIILL